MSFSTLIKYMLLVFLTGCAGSYDMAFYDNWFSGGGGGGGKISGNYGDVPSGKGFVTGTPIKSSGGSSGNYSIPRLPGFNVGVPKSLSGEGAGGGVIPVPEAEGLKKIGIKTSGIGSTLGGVGGGLVAGAPGAGGGAIAGDQLEALLTGRIPRDIAETGAMGAISKVAPLFATAMGILGKYGSPTETVFEPGAEGGGGGGGLPSRIATIPPIIPTNPLLLPPGSEGIPEPVVTAEASVSPPIPDLSSILATRGVRGRGTTAPNLSLFT